MYLKESRKRGRFIMTSETLVISFEGVKEDNYEVLSDLLDSTVETLRRLADYHINENEYRKFKVTGIQNGSIRITINQIFEHAAPILPTLLQVLKELIEIRIFLKGKPPKNIQCQGDTVEITNNQGNIKSVKRSILNGYDNEVEKELASVVSKAVAEKSTGLSYTFIHEGVEECLYLDKKHLSLLCVPQDVEKYNKEVEENENITYVKVRKPDLSGNTEWGCILNGENISCMICDYAFLEKVHSNEISFTSSTHLYVKLLIRYKEAEILSYRITEVLDILNE